MRTRWLILGLSATLFSGCAVGPNYKRPLVKTPDSFLGAAEASAPVAPHSIADQKWPEVFPDPQLQQLIRTALAQNYDLRIAASRILQAQAALRITRADQFPTVAAGATIGS